MDNGLLQACLHKDHWTYFYWRIQYSEKIGRIFELQSVGGGEENRKDFRAAVRRWQGGKSEGFSSCNKETKGM